MKEINFKNLMKNKLFVGGVSAVLVIIITVTVVLLIPNNTPLNTPDTSSGTSDVTVNAPDINVPESNSTTAPSDTESNKSGETGIDDISVDVGGNSDGNGGVNSGSKTAGKTPAESGAAPVITSKPEEESNIIIGGDEPKQTAYSCGTANHHCINAENHAYIQNLELEGCPYCGSHSCKSFYYVSPAGIPICNPSLCPKYSEKSDPIKYCSKCGREMWSINNPTGCFSYLQKTECECGQIVEGNTCHHH